MTGAGATVRVTEGQSRMGPPAKEADGLEVARGRAPRDAKRTQPSNPLEISVLQNYRRISMCFKPLRLC